MIHNQEEHRETLISALIRKNRNLICTLINVGIFVFHLLEMTVTPPKTKPDLFKVLNNALSFAFFFMILVYIHCLMYEE